MPDKDGQPLPPLPDDVFDGEKYSTEVKTDKCVHDLELIDSNTVKCRRCRAGWTGQGIIRLYEAWQKTK